MVREFVGDSASYFSEREYSHLWGDRTLRLSGGLNIVSSGAGLGGVFGRRVLHQNQARHPWRKYSDFKKMGDPTIENNCASQDALKQETSAGPAFGECGKQALQAYSPTTGLMLVEF